MAYEWVSGVGNVAGSIINGLFNSAAQNKANQVNKEIAQMNNEWSRAMMQEQNQFNYNMANEFFDKENAYNDPSAIRQRLQDAGYNPFVENGTMVGATNGDAATPVASGLPSPVTPQINPVPSPLNGVLPEIADSMLKFAQARKYGLDTKFLEKIYTEQVRELQINNDWADFYNDLRKEFEPSNQQWQNEQYRSNVQKTFKEINKLVSDIQLQQKQGLIFDEDLAIKKFNKVIEENNAKWIDKMNEQRLRNAVAEGNSTNASAEASRASAEASRSSARYTDRQRELLGRTINGIEVDTATLKNWERRLNQENINENQKQEIQHYINEIKKGKLNNWDTRALIQIATELEYVPLLKEIINFLQKF